MKARLQQLGQLQTQPMQYRRGRTPDKLILIRHGMQLLYLATQRQAELMAVFLLQKMR